MSPENFCYWLQGWFELNKTLKNDALMSDKTLEIIQEHLNLVFKKETLGYKMLDARFTGVSTQPLC